jgi:hypothetical protein
MIDKKSAKFATAKLMKKIKVTPKKLIIPIFGDPDMYKNKTVHVPHKSGMFGHFIATALFIEENKIEIYDSFTSAETIYLPDLKKMTIEILEEFRAKEQLPEMERIIKVVNPEGQVENDCGPITCMFAELFFLKKERYISDLQYNNVTLNLRGHHKDCIMKDEFVTRLDISIRHPLLESTPRMQRKRKLSF